MELILVAIVALVVLSGMDADLWPRPLPKARRSEPVSYTHLTLPTIYSV